jgi:hypothetical protein
MNDISIDNLFSGKRKKAKARSTNKRVTKQIEFKQVPVGQIFVEQYGHRWKDKAEQRKIEGKCCWGNCDIDHAGIYMGFPFCEHHWEWVEQRLEEIYEKETE